MTPILADIVAGVRVVGISLAPPGQLKVTEMSLVGISVAVPQPGMVAGAFSG
jgi:hypothetical protein